MGKRKRGFASDFGPRKCPTRHHQSEDRISVLPNEILIYILSFLTFKEAARTSVLSKRWIHVWTYVACVDLDASTALRKIPARDYDNSIGRERLKFVEWVNKMLQSHKALMLDEFRVFCDLDRSNQKEIDEWLQFAFARKVQRLELSLIEHGGLNIRSSGTYSFPSGALGLRNWNSLEKNIFVDVRSLRELVLKRVNVSGENLEFLLHNCKFLERLVVHRSIGLTHLEVSGSSVALKHLEICYCSEIESVIVSNVNLVSLKIMGPDILVLEDVPVLVDVCVYGCTNIIKDVFLRFSCLLAKLKVLTLSVSTTQAEVVRAKFAEISQLTGLRQLILLLTELSVESLLGFTYLIRASPNLEKFVMKRQWAYPERTYRESEKAVMYSDAYRGEAAERIRREDLSYVICPHYHLKVVEFCGYWGGAFELELVKYFIESAVCLENIIIDPRRQRFNEDPWFTNGLRKSTEIKMEEDGRSQATEQLQELIPSHVVFTMF